MQRRSVLKLLVVPIVLRGGAAARADCAMAYRYAVLATDLTRPVPRGGALLASVVEDFDDAIGPRMTPSVGDAAPSIDADLLFVGAGGRAACTVTSLGGGYLRLAPATPLAEGETELVGFHARGRPTAPRSFEIRGALPAPLPVVNAVSGTYAEHEERATRWGTPIRYRAEVALDRPLPPDTFAVLFETSLGHAVRLSFEPGGRAARFDATLGGAHCGEGPPPGGTVPTAGLDGRVVLVDRHGRLARSTRLVRLG